MQARTTQMAAVTALRSRVQRESEAWYGQKGSRRVVLVVVCDRLETQAKRRRVDADPMTGSGGRLGTWWLRCGGRGLEVRLGERAWGEQRGVKAMRIVGELAVSGRATAKWSGIASKQAGARRPRPRETRWI